MKASLSCPNCKHVIELNDRFCQECGARLQIAVIAVEPADPVLPVIDAGKETLPVSIPEPIDTVAAMPSASRQLSAILSHRPHSDKIADKRGGPLLRASVDIAAMVFMVSYSVLLLIWLVRGPAHEASLNVVKNHADLKQFEMTKPQKPATTTIGAQGVGTMPAVAPPAATPVVPQATPQRAPAPALTAHKDKSVVVVGTGLIPSSIRASTVAKQEAPPARVVPGSEVASKPVQATVEQPKPITAASGNDKPFDPSVSPPPPESGNEGVEERIPRRGTFFVGRATGRPSHDTNGLHIEAVGERPAPADKKEIAQTPPKNDYKDKEVTEYQGMMADYFLKRKLTGNDAAASEPPTYDEWLERGKPAF